MGLEDDARARKAAREQASPQERLVIHRREQHEMVRAIQGSPIYPEINYPRFFEYRELLARQRPLLRAEPIYRSPAGLSISKDMMIGEGWALGDYRPGMSYGDDSWGLSHEIVLLTTGWLATVFRKGSKILLESDPLPIGPGYDFLLLDLAEKIL